MRCMAPLFGLAALGALGCGRPPPPPPKAPLPPPAVALVEAPKKAPKCEAMDEECTATAGVPARIAATEWTFEPPPGWRYAQEQEATVALSESAALAVMIYEVAEPKVDAARRDQISSSITLRLGVGLAKNKKLVWPKKPDNIVAVGALKVSLYQFDGAHRDATTGPLLMFTAKLPSGQSLLGGGFVSDDDATNADKAILKAIGSLASPAADPALSPAAVKMP